jgi:DNA polymerase III sliding clamp (beta) subunit (PCNA family)
MQVVVAQKDLKAVLDIAQNTLGSSADISSHFLFDVKENNQVNVMSSESKRLYSCVPLSPCKSTGVGKFTVEGKRLVQAVNAIGDGSTIILDSDDKGNVTLSREGKSKGKMNYPGLDPDTFPDWENEVSKATLSKVVSSKLLTDCLNAIKPYVSTEDTKRPELCQAIIKEGKMMATDAFSLAVLKSDSLSGIDFKIQLKDFSNVLKFLKAHENQDVEIYVNDKSHILKSQDGTIIGFMRSQHNFPNLPSHFLNSFDWTPRRVWAFDKEALLSGIKLISSGADKNDFFVTFDHPEDSLTNPTLTMDSLTERDSLVEEVPLLVVNPADATEFPLKMVINNQQQEKQGADTGHFKFNYKYLENVLSSTGSEVVFGCNKENNKGYMLFRNKICDKDVDMVSIVAWVS